MNKNNTIPTLAITRLAPRLAAHPALYYPTPHAEHEQAPLG